MRHTLTPAPRPPSFLSPVAQRNRVHAGQPVPLSGERDVAGTCGEGTGGEASVQRGVHDVPLSLAAVRAPDWQKNCCGSWGLAQVGALSSTCPAERLRHWDPALGTGAAP